MTSDLSGVFWCVLVRPIPKNEVSSQEPLETLISSGQVPDLSHYGAHSFWGKGREKQRSSKVCGCFISKGTLTAHLCPLCFVLESLWKWIRLARLDLFFPSKCIPERVERVSLGVFGCVWVPEPVWNLWDVSEVSKPIDRSPPNKALLL